MDKEKKIAVFSNIEKILLRAATDEDFRDKLSEDKKSAIENPEFSLTDRDKMFLNSIPQKKLNGMVENFITQRSSRRNFLKGATASAALVISASMVPLSSVLAGGDTIITSDPTYGSRPDYPYPASTNNTLPPNQLPEQPIISATPEVYNSIITERLNSQGKTILYKYTGLKIVILPDSIKKSTDITIQLTVPSGVNYKNNFVYLGLVQITPIDTKFNREISICFPLVNKKGLTGYTLNETSYNRISSKITPGENLSEFISSEVEVIPDKSFWESIEVEILEGYAIIKTKKLGIYTVGYFI